MKKSIKIIISVFLLVFALSLSCLFKLRAATSNLPSIDPNEINPGMSGGLSAQVTKFDVYDVNDPNGTNYATTKFVNVKLNETKEFSLDFFTINWYGDYPDQTVSLIVNDNDIVDVNYYKNAVISNSITLDGKKKTISETLVNRLVDNKLNPDFPKQTFKLEGKTEGTTILDIVVNSAVKYGTTKTEKIRLVVTVGEKDVIDIPNYLNVSLDVIHSGLQQVAYQENAHIGVLTELVKTIRIIIPKEITDYNSQTPTGNEIKYRIVTDNLINVTENDLSFNIESGIASFFIQYYVISSTGDEVVIKLQKYNVVLYSFDNIYLSYGNSEFPSDSIYMENTPIVISTNETWLEPFLKELVVAYYNETPITIIPYVGDYVYIFEKQTDSKLLCIGDKFLAEVGMSNYDSKSCIMQIQLKNENIIDEIYPTEIQMESEYNYEVYNSLEERLEIANYQDFNATTKFTVISEGILSANYEDGVVLIQYTSATPLEKTISEVITVRAELNNGTFLEKQITIRVAPHVDKEYGFDCENVIVIEGESKTITFGYVNDGFSPLETPIDLSYKISRGNIIVDLSSASENKYIICGYKPGKDMIYFSFGDIIVSVEVEVIGKYEQKIKQLNFEQGTDISIICPASTDGSIIHDEIESILSIPQAYSELPFQFIVVDDSIIRIRNTYENIAYLKCLRGGTTQVYALARIEDTLYTAIINITVITEVPEVYIIYEKDDQSTALTKYDDVHVSFNVGNFEFSPSTRFEWYVNDTKIELEENVREFTHKFDEGINTVKLVIEDQAIGYFKEVTQQINVLSAENTNKDRTISIAGKDLIYVDLHQGSFNLSALLDGVVNPNYSYIWSIDNSAICKISINGNQTLVLDPVSLGETTLTVMVNIAKTTETFIKAEIKIVVLEPKYTIESDKFIKPNSNPKFRIVGNGKTIENLKAIIDIKCNDESFTDYANENNEIKIENITKGKYVISANIGGNIISQTYDVTNFNIKEIASVLLPYLVIAAVITLGVYLIVINRRSKLERTSKKIEKLDNITTTILAGEEYTVKELKKILKASISLKKMFLYCVDEGIDEVSLLVKMTDDINKILEAAIHVEPPKEKIFTIINSIKKKKIDRIISAFAVIKEERIDFETKKKEQEERTTPTKKHKMTREDFETYLNQSKIAEEDSDN
ncbi:MAG: hypothetical protein SOY80_06510 [Bacilli bacterium]|nr:hypothetical protein [Bacilli bacterium]